MNTKFTIFTMPCCSHELHWLGTRQPSYCPECGTRVYPISEHFVLVYFDDVKLVLPVEIRK